MFKLLTILAAIALGIALTGVVSRRLRNVGMFRALSEWGGPTFADHFLGLALASGYTAILLATSHDLGFMRDEGMYFDASKSYAAWFEALLSPDPKIRKLALERGSVDVHWAPNAEHPSLMKSSFALSWIYFWKTWPAGLIELFSRSWLTTPLAWAVKGAAKVAPKLFMEESASFRFPGMVAGGLILWITYLFGAQAVGRAGGLIAAVLMAAVPRAYFDAHLAGFDAAATLAWLSVAYAYWRGLSSMPWAVMSGIIWGGALLMKHNSWFLPVVFVVHYTFVAIDMLRKRPGQPPTLRGRIKTLPIPWPFLFMGMFGPAIFIYGWPRLWFDTWARMDFYFTFHAKHDFYNIEYLHKTYFEPPFPISMPSLLVLATVPLGILVAALVGVFSRLKRIVSPILSAADRDPQRTSFFLFFNLILPIALISHPRVPHFGGTKHWHPAYPFLCIFAGLGIVLAGHRLVSWIRLSSRRALATRLCVGFCATCVVLPAAIETKRSHPHGLSHYTPIVGGPAGGADLGLNRGFWGYEPGAIVDWLKQHFPQGGRVYPNDMFQSSFEQLHFDGRLPLNIEAEWWTIQSADVAVVQHEQHMDEVEHQIWMAYGTVTPAHIVTLGGVPVLTVYVNPRTKKYVP